MLFANLDNFNKKDYEHLQEAINFLKTTDLTKTPLGRSHQKGESFFVKPWITKLNQLPILSSKFIIND